MKNKKIEMLVESAIMIALAVALDLVSSVLPFTQLPFGGKFTICAMLPLVYIAVRYGLGTGLLSGFVYSLIQLAIGFAKHPSSLMLDKWYLTVLMLFIDYILAYTALGLGSLGRGLKAPSGRFTLGAFLGTLFRYVCHIVSGAIFYGAWATWFFEEGDLAGTAFAKFFLDNFSGTGMSIAYSAVYNGLYMIPEIIITTVVAFALSKIPVIAKRV